MKSIAKTLFTLLVTIGLSANSLAQIDDVSGDPDVQAMIATLNEDIAELKRLSEVLLTTENLEHDLLVYRRDERGFHVLADIDALIDELAGLPDGSPVKEQVKAELTVLCAGVGDTVFNRIEEIGQSISESRAELESLSDGARVAEQARIQVLQSIRINYYKSLANHLEDRDFLGLPSQDLRTRLEPNLYLYAETLAGQVQLSSAALNEVGHRADLDPENAGIASASMEIKNRYKVNMRRLEEIIDVLDSLGLDSSKYQAVMLQQSSAISVNYFSMKAIASVIKDSWSSFRTAMKENALDLIFKIIVFFVVLYIFKLLARLSMRIVRSATERSTLDMSKLLKDILISLTGSTVMVVGVFVALSQVGLSLGPMFAGLGIAGFIIGFALQDTLGNFAAGAMILIYRPFDVGDNVEVTGASGLVKKMNLVSTTITTFDNQTLVVPNSKIWGDVIKNITAQTERRIDLEIGIGYEEDIEHAERVFAEIVEAHEKVLKDPAPNIRVHTLGDSSVNMIVRPWVKTEDYWDTYWDLMRAIKVGLDREGISIPFPQRDVHFFPEKPEQDDEEAPVSE